MRIGHLTDMYPMSETEKNGHAVRDLVHALRQVHPEYEHDVHVFFALGSSLLKKFSSEYMIKSDALRCGPNNPSLYYRYLLQLPKALFSRVLSPFWHKHIFPRSKWLANYDLIHVHTCYNLACGAALAGIRLGVPVVATIRREQQFPVWTKRTKLFSIAMKQVNMIISPSAHLADKCRQTYGREVRIIPSGTNPLFDEKPSNLARNRRVLFVGTLDSNKGIKALLQASLKLFAKGMDFEVFVVGESYFRQHSDRLELEKLVRGHPRIKFLGTLSPKEVRDQMRQAQLLCLPSYTETLGIVFIEAMKQGLPVIGRCGTGIDGMGKAGRDYELIKHDEELCSLLPALLDDHKRCMQIGKAGQHLAENWTWKNSAIQHMDIYERLIHKRNAQ